MKRREEKRRPNDDTGDVDAHQHDSKNSRVELEDTRHPSQHSRRHIFLCNDSRCLSIDVSSCYLSRPQIQEELHQRNFLNYRMMREKMTGTLYKSRGVTSQNIKL